MTIYNSKHAPPGSWIEKRIFDEMRLQSDHRKTTIHHLQKALDKQKRRSRGLQRERDELKVALSAHAPTAFAAWMLSKYASHPSVEAFMASPQGRQRFPRGTTPSVTRESLIAALAAEDFGRPLEHLRMQPKMAEKVVDFLLAALI